MAQDGKIYGTTVATTTTGVFMAGVKSPYGVGDDVAVPANAFGSGTTPTGLVNDGVMTRRAADGGGDLTGTDNTAAVQAAITRAATSGDTVHVPPGKYNVYALTIPSNVKIVGAGVDQTFFYTKYAAATAAIPRPAGATFTGSYSSISGFTWVSANEFGTFGSHLVIGSPDVAIGGVDTIKRGNQIRDCKLISYGPSAGGNHAIDQYGWTEDSLIEDVWFEGQYNYAFPCHWSGDFGVSVNSSRATKSWHPHNLTFRRVRGTCATYKGNVFHLASSGRVVYEDCDVDASELYTMFYGDAGNQFAQNITPEQVLAGVVYRHCTGTTDLLGFQGTANSNAGGTYITYGALETMYGNDKGNKAGCTIDQCSLNIRDYPGVTVGGTLTIAGVTGTKTVDAISGNLVTLDSTANATVSDAAVTFTSPITTTVTVLSPIAISNIHFQVADASSFRNAMNITISGVSGTRLITQIWGNTIAVSTAVTGIAVGATVTQVVLGSITSGEKFLRLSAPTSQTFTGTGAQETNLLTVSSVTGLFVGAAITSTTLVSGETHIFVIEEIDTTTLILTLDRNLPAEASTTTFTTTGGVTRVLPIVYSYLDNLTINNFDCRYSDTAASTWAMQVVAINTVTLNGGHLKSRFGIHDRLIRDFEVNGTIIEGVHTDVETNSIGLAVTNTAPQTVTTSSSVAAGGDTFNITTLTATTFTGTGSSGSASLTVSSAAGLSVGNTITSATLTSGSTQAFKISAINSLVLTLNRALPAAASTTTFTLTTPLTVGLYPGSMVYYNGNYYEVDGVTTPEDYVFHGAGAIPIKLVKLRADDATIPDATSVKLIPLTRRAIMRGGAIRAFNIGAYAASTGTNYEEFLPSFVMDGTSIEDCGIQAVKIGKGVKSYQLNNIYLNGNGRASYSTAQGLGVSLNEGDGIIDGLITGANELEPYAIYTGTVHKSLTISNSHIQTHSSSVANSAAIYLPADPNFAPELNNVSYGGNVTQQFYPTTAYIGSRVGGKYIGTGTAVPSTGTWNITDEIANRLGTGGWHCTTGGTFGTLNGGATTAATTASSALATLSSLTGIFVGAYVTIAGVTGVKRIAEIRSSTQVLLDSTADATVGAGATAYSTPTFVRFLRNYKGADIVAASPLNLDTRTGDLVDVTGNTNFSAVTLAEGQQCLVRFTGTPTITVGASLVGNGGGSNITMAAGDFALFRGYASGVVRFVAFRASGKGVVGPASTDITDATTAGRNMITAADVAAQQLLLTHAPQVDNFTGSNTWTKPTGCTYVLVEMIGAGGGGGSGRKGAAGTVRTGGAGGGGGTYVTKLFAASELTSTVAVSIGSGGGGGAIVSASDTNGNAGAPGGDTTFAAYIRAPGGGGGSGGAAASATGGAGYGSTVLAGAGGASNNTGLLGQSMTAFQPVWGAGGGAPGGGITSANAESAGGTGGNGGISNTTTPTGGAGGAAGVAGSVGTAVTANTPQGGGAGGGGGSSVSTNAGAGGYGGIYGGGAGGGGAAVNAVGDAGAGGNGANGFCRVTSYFTP